MSDLWRRLKREVKANGKKAGLLAGLFLFGCCFWIPMLTRSVAPKRAAAAPHSTATTPSPVSANTTVNPAAPAALSEAGQGKFWANLTQSLAEDPMFQSAGVNALSRDPFHVAVSSEPLPVLLVEEPKPKVEIEPDNEPLPLELHSTVISHKRRAALINGQLYQLGRRLQANGRSYQVTEIESHRVLLSSNGQTVELTLARPRLNDVLERGEPIASPSQ